MTIRKKDLRWLLALPLYILLNSLRHQLANAAMVALTGGTLTSFSLLPTLQPQGWLRFGEVGWQGGTAWMILAAPYLADLLLFLLVFIFLSKILIKRRWLFLNLLIIGLVSPLFNSAHDYFSTVFTSTDISLIIAAMRYEELVHLFFVSVLSFYVLGLQSIVLASATRMYWQKQANLERRRLRKEKKVKSHQGKDEEAGGRSANEAP